jgi:TldD protein
VELKNRSELKKIFLKLVDIMEQRCRRADVLLIERKELAISRDFSTVDVENVSERGIKLRAYTGNKYYETHTTNLDEANLVKIAEELVANLPENKEIPLTKDFLDKDFSEKCKINPDSIKFEDKIKLTEAAVQKMKNSNLQNARCNYEEEITFKAFCSRNKFLTQRLQRVLMLVIPYIKAEDGSTRYAFEQALANGYEATKDIDEKIKKVLENIMHVKVAKKIKPGKYTTITCPDPTGVLAHESFGHGAESDTAYKGRAKMAEHIGDKIAPDFVNIIDDPSIEGTYGHYFFDDEGEFVKPTYMIKDGVITDYITESFSIERMGKKQSANGRAQSFDHKSYARMSTTFFGAGKDSLKDMIANVKDGIFFIGPVGGMEDPKGWGVQLQRGLAQRIKNGKLTDEYYWNVSVTGYLPTILSNIKKVSKEFEITHASHCGKGHKEWIEVASGGPYLLIENLDLG